MKMHSEIFLDQEMVAAACREFWSEFVQHPFEADHGSANGTDDLKCDQVLDKHGHLVGIRLWREHDAVQDGTPLTCFDAYLAKWNARARHSEDPKIRDINFERLDTPEIRRIFMEWVEVAESVGVPCNQNDVTGFIHSARSALKAAGDTTSGLKLLREALRESVARKEGSPEFVLRIWRIHPQIWETKRKGEVPA